MSAAGGQRGLNGMRFGRGGRIGDLRALLVPPDWFFAVRAGVELVIGAWLVVLLPVLAVFVTTSSMDAAAALSLGKALRVGTGLWSLGLGGSYGRASSPAGVLGLPLLGVTLLQALIARSSVRRARLSGSRAGAWTVTTSVLTATAVAALSGPAGSRTWPAVLGVGVISALVVVWSLGRAGRLPVGLADRWARRPPWADPALALARTTAAALAVVACLAGLAALIGGAGRMSRLHGALSAGGIVATAGLVLLQLGWAPTVIVWALSWVAGPGFAVGRGTTFSPDHVQAGAVPVLPLLGLLPAGPLGGEGSRLGLYLPLVVTVAALVVVWIRRRELAGLTLGRAVIAALAAAGLVGVGTAAVCAAASGPIGPGRLARTGPFTVMTVLLVLVEVGVGLVAGALVTHPATRILTERGVRSTAQAAEAAAQSARERVEEGLGMVRDRSTEGRAARDAEQEGTAPEKTDRGKREKTEQRESEASWETGRGEDRRTRREPRRGRAREEEPWSEDAEPPDAGLPRFRASRAQRSRLFAGWRERASERDRSTGED